jgi:hypothetical protein
VRWCDRPTAQVGYTARPLQHTRSVLRLNPGADRGAADGARQFCPKGSNRGPTSGRQSAAVDLIDDLPSGRSCGATATRIRRATVRSRCISGQRGQYVRKRFGLRQHRLVAAGAAQDGGFAEPARHALIHLAVDDEVVIEEDVGGGDVGVGETW